MNDESGLKVEIRDIAQGLWIWRVAHPRWKPNQSWDPLVTSTSVESGGEILVLDPLAPPATQLIFGKDWMPIHQQQLSF